MSSAGAKSGGGGSYLPEDINFFRHQSDSDDSTPRGRFVMRTPRDTSFEPPTFDRIMRGVQGFIRVPELPSLAKLTGLGSIPGIRSDSDDESVVVRPRINFPRLFTTSSPEPEDTEEEKLEKMQEVDDFGKKLQAKTLDYYNGEILSDYQRQNIKEMVTHFAKFAINDYTDCYRSVWSVLLDVKAFYKYRNDPESANMVLSVLKILRSKYIREGIPSGGAGGHDLYEYTPL